MSIQRPWCICISDDTGGSRINEAHLVAVRLSVNDRENVLRAANDIVGVLGTKGADWKDDVPEQERRRWASPLEMLVNVSAWSHIRHVFPEALRADIEAVLETENLPLSSLSCLDEDDRESLTDTLAEAAVSAYENANDVSATMRTRLIEWLQDWTMTDDENLEGLVHRVREMAEPDAAESSVNWIGEGF